MADAIAIVVTLFVFIFVVAVFISSIFNGNRLKSGSDECFQRVAGNWGSSGSDWKLLIREELGSKNPKNRLIHTPSSILFWGCEKNFGAKKLAQKIGR